MIMLVIVIKIILTFLFYEGFKINDTVTCNTIQFIYIVTSHSLTYTMYRIYMCRNSFTFIHTFIHIHNHTQGNNSEYWTFKLQSDLKKNIYNFIYMYTH